MKKLMLVIFAGMVLIMLVGCSGPRIIYSKPGLTTNEFNRDKYACVQQSQQSWSAGGSGAAGGMMIIAAQADAENRQQALFKMCMEARGYTAREETEKTVEPVKAVETAEERERTKQYSSLMADVNKAQSGLCKKDNCDLIFKKSACTMEEITIQQLTDKSFASEEEKACMLTFLAERREIATKIRKLAEMTQDLKTKEYMILRADTHLKDEESALSLYEGKMCWGDYNKIRKNNLQAYRDEYRKIYSK